MNWLDGVLLAVVGASTFYGVRRGLVLEAFALVALVAGAGAGIAYHDLVGAPLEGVVKHAGAARFVGFAVVFLAVGGAVFALGKWVRAFVHAVFLGWVDGLGGGLVGFLKGAFAAWALLTLGVAYLPIVQGASETSQVAPMLLSVSEQSRDLLPEELSDLVQKRMAVLRKVWKELNQE